MAGTRLDGYAGNATLDRPPVFHRRRSTRPRSQSSASFYAGYLPYPVPRRRSSPDLNTTVALLPEGLTGQLQPLDTSDGHEPSQLEPKDRAGETSGADSLTLMSRSESS
jgi:hypothetical protein